MPTHILLVFLFQAHRIMAVISLFLLTVGSWDQWAIWAVGEIMLFSGCSCCCSVAKLCPTFCDPMDCSTPGSSVLHYLWVCSNLRPLIWWCHPTISSSVALFSCLQSFPASGSFPISWVFLLGGQSTGASASASVLPMNIQDWFPLGTLCPREETSNSALPFS